MPLRIYPKFLSVKDSFGCLSVLLGHMSSKSAKILSIVISSVFS